MTEKIITVVGGSGFLGQYVVRELAKKGYRVRVICRRPERAQELKTCGNLGQIAVLKGNITRPESLAQHLKDAYGVVNLVGLLYEKGAQRFSTVHAKGAEKLAQMAKTTGAKAFVHISALGVEEASGSQYARTKALGEKAVREAFPEATVLRPGVIFGPEDDFFNKFACMAVFSPVLPLVGGGATLFQPVFVEDVAKAVAESLENPVARGKLFELGGPEAYSFRQILEFILLTIHRRRRLIPLPFPLASALAAAMEWLPKPPLTRDQVRLLQRDNVVSPHALGFSILGIQPQAVEMVVPDYLARFRKGGHA